MLRLIAAAILLIGMSGCVPLMVGGFIGYQVAAAHEHDAWCGQHVGDPSCHP